MTMHYYWVSVFEHKFKHSEGQPLQCDRWPAKKLSSHTVYSPAHFERFRRTINLGRRFWLVSYVGPICFTKIEEGPRIVTNEIAGRDTSQIVHKHFLQTRRPSMQRRSTFVIYEGHMTHTSAHRCWKQEIWTSLIYCSARAIIKVLVFQLDLYWRNL
jgi:hypothetical protein